VQPGLVKIGTVRVAPAAKVGGPYTPVSVLVNDVRVSTARHGVILTKDNPAGTPAFTAGARSPKCAKTQAAASLVLLNLKRFDFIVFLRLVLSLLPKLELEFEIPVVPQNSSTDGREMLSAKFASLG
jgi:hypothetical protein